ncbi:MAG: hypothetical protein AABW83_03045 [Nanoarchaeota archaeon]
MKYLFFLFVIFNIAIVSAEINYEINFDDDEIVNSKEFNIYVKINGENDKVYDGKLWIEKEGNIISERYDSENNLWKSSYYYLNQYFENGKEQEVKLRINKKYEDFYGDAYIHFKIRDKKEIKEEIVIIKNKEKKETSKNKNFDNDNKNSEIEDKKDGISQNNIKEDSIEEINNIKEEIRIEPIILGKKFNSEVANLDDKIIYKSEQMRMVDYSIYSFSVLCVLLVVFIIWKKL